MQNCQDIALSKNISYLENSFYVLCQLPPCVNKGGIKAMHPKDVVTREDCIAICIFIPRIHVQQFYNIFQQKEDERFLWAHTLNAKERNVMEVIIKLKATHRALFFAFLESLCRNHGFRLHKEND